MVLGMLLVALPMRKLLLTLSPTTDDSRNDLPLPVETNTDEVMLQLRFVNCDLKF